MLKTCEILNLCICEDYLNNKTTVTKCAHTHTHIRAFSGPSMKKHTPTPPLTLGSALAFVIIFIQMWHFCICESIHHLYCL